ncbi:MAG TPA: response regulator [Crenalkalicoccus sp.]|jgi:CheY-like chemotaxis protein|nr:response regulator [Crenalkalicoccus sp.]
MTLRVLMAEDEPLAAEVLRELLMDAGMEVLVAADGQEAVEIAEGGACFDVLLTDLRMPRLDGRELIRRLRTVRPGLPVVVMTGFVPAEGTRAVQFGHGPLRLLAKPLMAALLLQAVQEVAAGS